MRAALLLLAGCAADPAGTAPASTPGVEDRSGPTDTGGSDLPAVSRPSTQADWSPADVEAAVARALADGLPDPWAIQEDYLWVLSHGNSACPGHPTYIDDTHLLGCETGSGWFYSGVSEWLVTEGVTEDGAQWDAIEALGDILFRSPEGAELEAGGHVKWTRIRSATGLVTGFSTEVQGSWRWEGDDAWLAETVSGLYATELGRGEAGRFVEIDGAARVYGVDLAFDGVRIEEGACGWAPTGTLRVRDPSTAWHTVAFGEACTPCGAASFQGAATGEVCVDLAPVADGLAPHLEAL